MIEKGKKENVKEIRKAENWFMSSLSMRKKSKLFRR